MRIGILQCDSVAPDLQAEFGDYPDMFRKLLSSDGTAPDCRTYDLTRDEFPAATDECDAWLFTGSQWSVYDPDEWIVRAHAFARALHGDGRPTVGICFGHQLIARALGGEAQQAAAGWGVGVHTARILRPQPWMDPERPTLSLLVSHQDQVTAPPPGAQVLAGHEFCPYDMLQIDDHVLTLQGHPEFERGYAQAIMDRRREAIGEQTYFEGRASLASPIEPAIAAQWIHRFLARAGAARSIA
jgi:GMP synthase-like glutamine amidotransferase